MEVGGSGTAVYSYTVLKSFIEVAQHFIAKLQETLQFFVHCSKTFVAVIVVLV
jgi:hypothetical protein